MRVADVVLDGAACVHLHGKGRKQRTVPLWPSTVKAIRAWLRLNPELGVTSALLPNRDGQADDPQQRDAAAGVGGEGSRAEFIPAWPSGASRRTPSATPPRCTCCSPVLGSDVVAMWLGHESPTTTHQYTEADLAMKEQALAKLQDPDTAARRYRAPDSLIEFLKSL